MRTKLVRLTDTPAGRPTVTVGAIGISQLSLPRGNATCTLPPAGMRPAVVNTSVCVDNTPGVAMEGRNALTPVELPASIAGMGTARADAMSPPPWL